MTSRSRHLRAIHVATSLAVGYWQLVPSATAGS